MDFDLRLLVEIGFGTYFAYRLYQGFSLKDIFRRINRIPFIKSRIDAQVKNQLGKVMPGLVEDRFKHVELPNDPKVMQERIILQAEPMNHIDILARIDQICPYNKADYKISGAIYANEDKYSDLVGKIYAKTAWLNPTHATVWPELIQMEAETYAMICELFQLTEESPAILTPGGTMSNVQAIYTYRNMMELTRGIITPNIVAPITAHSSFKKACEIMKIEYRMADVDPSTGKADVRSMRRLIDSNTICLVGSAPSYPYGILDPIEQIGKLSREKNLPFHVDCCLGGFMVPFAPNLSEVCDFRNPNITSISADPHKFGQTPKGISILMFASNDIKKYLTFVDLKWAGGLYVMPDFLGSRAGSNIAVLWAIMKATGREEYTQITHDLIEMRQELTNLIRERFSRGLESEIELIRVHGNPELSTFGMKSDRYNIHFVNKIMSKQFGWEFNSLPDGLHFCLTNKHLQFREQFVREFIQDLEKTIEYIDENPDEDPGDTAQIYCSTQEIPDFADDILDEIGRAYTMVQGMIIPQSLTNK